MKNYVIINGTNSNTLTGLMINELPPITKPEMRTQVEEIDGRDGDIITKLGYSAYDKTITIGLFGTGYDVDNIIKFFNKEGTIVFSNEPDKYYNFTQVNGFDIERLLKFKTASITFHCQPFKYPTIETQKIIQPTILTSDGESITINNTASDSLKLSLKGNTSQASTPTPTSPIPVSVVSGDNEVTISNSDNTQSQTYEVDLPVENLVNNALFTASGGVTIKSYDNYQFIGTYASPYTAITQYVNVSTGKYTFSVGNIDNSTARVEVYKYKNGSQVGRVQLVSANSSYTIDNTDNSADQIRITLSNSNLSGTNEITFSHLQLEKGSKANTFVPYGTTPIELCKIGNYQDRIYKDNGNWYIEKQIGKIVLDGTQSTAREQISNSYYKFYINNIPNVDYGDASYVPKIMSDKLVAVGRTPMYLNTQGITSANNNLQVYTEATKNMTVDEFRPWLSNNKITVYYGLTTPTTTLIEDTNLISQLDDIEGAYSYETQTNISQTNNDKPFIISASAVQSGTNEITINNIGNIYSKPLLALEGNGNVDIYLDDTQILKANVESKMNIDIAQLEAYNPDTSALLNRQVIGNYNSMTFQPGNNKLTINGSLNKATITNYTRWL